MILLQTFSAPSNVFSIFFVLSCVRACVLWYEKYVLCVCVSQKIRTGDVVIVVAADMDLDIASPLPSRARQVNITPFATAIRFFCAQRVLA